ncbi:Ldh family oxidoreductase [Agrobacterium tumefaciens]|uniref:Ldh family oxidoreductase n=1 Tax=Agrobacterium tumefaciens TaxID=358 RepID=A0AA44F5C2_AGRTU|nr:Ldh family oxidoreductase [Agrobacterium tumefaciens]NTB87559.1 Ldh family oxidoreductase [Agrobacterium tumefaciens]NTC19746.1 Ldh family oxidoreductase [Agrobacterium tumefaciens]NTC29674.1 Ldh family oxidoreductase [Agrobacterium tumefaciens]
MSKVLYYSPDALTNFATSVFETSGMPQASARIISGDLVRANLRGVDSHGVSRIPMYMSRLRAGLVNPDPNIKITEVAGAVSQVDGDNAMGFLPAHAAMGEAMRIAEMSGIGLVGVHRSTHFGMGALYALQAADAGYISMVFTNSSPAIAMWGGRSSFLGASPIAAGIPGGRHPAYIMDMAMTVIARGKIRLAAMRGEPIPEGLALDVDGNPTTDAQKAFEGVCLPFGGVKGSVLATLMDLKAGMLTGANFAGDVKSLYFDNSEPQNVGHLFFAIKPDLFMSLGDFEARMGVYYERIRSMPLAAGVEEVLMPGQPEARREAKRRLTGIPVGENIAAELAEEGSKVDIRFPEGHVKLMPINPE